MACNYCNRIPSYPLYLYSDLQKADMLHYYVESKSAEIQCLTYTDGGIPMTGKASINFCPMCGEQLRSELVLTEKMHEDLGV